MACNQSGISNPEDLNLQIRDVNGKLHCSIQEVQQSWSASWLAHVTAYYKLLQKEIDADLAAADQKRIQYNIEFRAQMVVMNQRRLIASILERNYRRVNVERLLVT